MSSSIIADKLDQKLQIPVTDAIQVFHAAAVTPEINNCVTFVDGTWWLPGTTATTGRQGFETGPRIPGAIYCDIDDLATKDTPKNLPHMMPPPELWAAYLSAMGIALPQQHVIIYGQTSNCPFVHRTLIQFWSMGHDWSRLHLLQGSLEDWQAAGGPVDSATNTVLTARQVMETSSSPSSSSFYQATRSRAIATMSQVREIIDGKQEGIIVDVRSPDRFYGRVDEPRPGLQLGHMPGARNLFFMDLLDPQNPIRLKPRRELEDILNRAGLLSGDQIVVASCGSGASACALKTAMIECGQDPNRVYIYDGSWSEWGAYPENPVTKED